MEESTNDHRSSLKWNVSLFCERQRTFDPSFSNIWFETVVILWWHSARRAPLLRWLSCSLWSSSSSSSSSTLSTSQTIKPLSLSIHIQQHRNSFGPLASVISFFRSLPTARSHRWGSGGRATGKSRALPLGSAPSLAPQAESHHLITSSSFFFSLSWTRPPDTWTLWLGALDHPWPGASHAWGFISTH